MKLFLLFAAAAAFVQVNSNSGIVEKSESPNGLYHIENTFTSDGTYFAVVTRNEVNVSPPFQSDFSILRSIALQCKLTRIFWRSDSSYFVLDSGHDRHHGDFLVVQKEGNAFQLLPFDVEKIFATSKLHAAFLYPDFKIWLPHNQLGIQIQGFNGMNSFCDVDFVLDLTNQLKVVSFKVGLDHKY